MKYLKITSSIFTLLALTACNTTTQNSSITSGTTYEPSALYKEYPFDSGDDVDLGFTKRELEKLESEENLLSEGSTVIEGQSMKYVRPTEKEMSEGTTDKYQWNDDIYETKNERGGNNASDNYVLLKNGEVIFEGPMVFSPIGAVIDWRIVEGKPAFTFNVAERLEGNSVTYTQDIWYDGELMSEKFSVENPRYLFSYEGKLGFVAISNGMDSIFYDGKFVTPGFTQIWTANCCSYTEILPTVYENGTLLFYAKRDGLNYLVETSLDTENGTESTKNPPQTPEEVLTSFFDALNQKDFEAAASFFDFEGHSDTLAYGTSQDAPKRLEEYCSAVPTCLKAKVLQTEQVSDDEYTLLVQFFNEDGSTYIFGPCCGASEEDMPSQETFDFTVQKIDGLFKVITPPLYRP